MGLKAKMPFDLILSTFVAVSVIITGGNIAKRERKHLKTNSDGAYKNNWSACVWTHQLRLI